MQARPLLPPVTVNGVEISAARIAAEAQMHPAPKGKPGHAWQAAARALAMRELLLQEARAREIAPAPVELAPGQLETDEEALIRQLLEAAVTPEPPGDPELRARYEARPDRFRAPALYEAAHILIATPPGTDRAEARARADALLDELRADPGRFGALAREYSACSSAANGGALGQISSGDTVPEFEAVLVALPEGAIAPEPVETRYGFHLIRLDARAEGAILPFDAVLPRLREAAQKAAWTRASRAFAARLAEGAEITGISLQPQGVPP